tara:strand:- start:1904 stop:2131 length:228 start_codon:yes stop_codon:yes gene_type:complete
MSEDSNVTSNVSEVNEKLNETVEVTVGDIQIMVNIIEAVTARGGFRAPELKGIGEFFEKLSGMLPKDAKANTTPQ